MRIKKKDLYKICDAVIGQDVVVFDSGRNMFTATCLRILFNRLVPFT